MARASRSEALLGFGSKSGVRRQNLDGEGAIEARIAAAVDFAHPAAAERATIS